MLTEKEETYILDNASVPEHIVSLMTAVSGGEPCLFEDYFCCRKKDWIIIVGYPLRQEFITTEFEGFVQRVVKKFRPKTVSLVAHHIPSALISACRETDYDHYYTQNIGNLKIKSVIKRNLKKARADLTVEYSNQMIEKHKVLSEEFVQRVNPSLRVRNLLSRMPQYVQQSSTAIVLNAWDHKNNLSAFYIVDFAAKDFATYVIGCYSKKNYVLGASDLLQLNMIELSKERGKAYIHLGLGVNEGVRRFKEKWGGIPTQNYEMCELVLKRPSVLESILSFYNRR